MTLPPVGRLPEVAATNRARWVGAFLVAVGSDAVSAVTGLAPGIQLGVDLATALLLWTLLGRRWLLLLALIPEAIPVVAVFPTWTLVVSALRLTARNPAQSASR